MSTVCKVGLNKHLHEHTGLQIHLLLSTDQYLNVFPPLGDHSDYDGESVEQAVDLNACAAVEYESTNMPAQTESSTTCLCKPACCLMILVLVRPLTRTAP